MKATHAHGIEPWDASPISLKPLHHRQRLSVYYIFMQLSIRFLTQDPASIGSAVVCCCPGERRCECT